MRGALQADRSRELEWSAKETQGDEGAAKLQEGQMDVSPVLVADLQTPQSKHPDTSGLASNDLVENFRSLNNLKVTTRGAPFHISV